MKFYKIFVFIILVQGIVESGNGNLLFVFQVNNYFGIKCYDWIGEKIYLDDDQKGECFCKYENGDEFYCDYSLFFVNWSCYVKLFIFDLMNYKVWVNGLKEVGYVISFVYLQKFIEVIECLKLDKYDFGLENLVGSDVLVKEF